MAKFDNVPYFMRTEMTKDRNYRRPKCISRPTVTDGKKHWPF